MEPTPRKIWTIQYEDKESNSTNVSRSSTAKKQSRDSSHQNNNNYMKDGRNSLIGVQSRFRRKGHSKYLVAVFLSLLFVVAMAFFMSIYFGRSDMSLCKTKNCLRAASNLLQSMDFRTDPCEDFYQFTCGNWAEDHPKPDSASSFDWFSEKQTKVLRFIRRFLASNKTQNEPEIIDQTRTMFKACMDTAQMDAIGLQAALDYLKLFRMPNFPSIVTKDNDEIGSLKDFDWIDTIAKIKRTIGLDVLFGFDVFPDPTNRTRNRIVLGTPETNSVLPFKSDYEKRLKQVMNKHIKQFDEFIPYNGDSLEIEMEIKEKSDDAVNVYTNYMTEVISAFVFYSKPTVQIDVVLPVIKNSANKIVKMTKFLIELAEEAENVTERDPNFVTNDLLNLNIHEFQNLSDKLIAPKTSIIWRQYLETVFKDVDPMFDVSEHLILTSWADIHYIQYALQYILSLPKIELELYIWWSIVEEFILHTTSDFRQLHNEYAKTITNLEGSTPRSLYCTSVVNQLMGMAVSYAIAQPDFVQVTKPRVLDMIEDIRSAFGNLVHEAIWMDKETKCSTLEKSQAMKSFVGFPEWILKTGELDKYYGQLHFNRTTHLDNLVNVLQWEMSVKWKSINNSEDMEWATTPTNVNAFHTFQSNAITVPLAILQYPFYNLGLESLNYGALGTILGHEMTHGFDNSGRQFDKDGNMRQWWTNRTISVYINLTDCFIKQYNNYYISDVDEHVCFDIELNQFEQYTHEQLLFISFGNLWCETQTTSAIKLALEDTHCPGRIRLKGVLDNSNEFKNAFNCHADLKKQNNQCRIW